jgi:hypothetical protein
MPLAKGKSKKATKQRFHEFRHGKTFAKTAKKFGKKRALKQLQAVALGGKKRKKRKASRKRKAKR